MTSLLDRKLSKIEINQALLQLKNYGVCYAKRTINLMELGCIGGYSKYFKPIPWAITSFYLIELGQQQALAAVSGETSGTKANKLIGQDPFQPSEIHARYYGELIFTEERIRAEIANGNHIEIGRAAGDVMPAYLRHELHPEYFPTEPTND